MPMTAFQRLFRYFALALAAIQIAAFAAAPALEAELVIPQANAAAAADQSTTDRGIPRHDPGTCVVCQIISVVAALPVPPTVPAPVSETRSVERPGPDRPSEHHARRDALSRAPPTLPA
jgi:hypothetical protein